MTLQQNENTVSSTAWYSSDDNTKGPLTAIDVLESATSRWDNVNTIDYTMGTTVFNGTNAYTGCSISENNWNCITNTYTLGSRSGKARMITGQEAISAGCTITSNSCPAWIRTGSGYYWTMSAYSSVSYDALIVYVANGCLGSNIISSSYDARAVVVISK